MIPSTNPRSAQPTSAKMNRDKTQSPPASSKPSQARHQRDYSPVHWAEYFHEAHDIELPRDNAASGSANSDSFRVYLKNFNHPYAPPRSPQQELDPQKVELSESELASYSRVPTLVALHGGGYSGLTWAQFARHIEQLCHCRVLAVDLRGHGDTKTLKDDQMDIDTLVEDVSAVTHAVHQLAGFRDTPKIVLIGHSMGGAIAVKCSSKCADLLPSLAGFVIIDVVEGTAKDALPLMMSVIKTRPTRFPSLSNAIEWSVRSGMAKNSEAARVSMPSNLVNISSGRLAIHDVPDSRGEGARESSTSDETRESCDSKRQVMASVKRHTFNISLDLLLGPTLPLPLLPRAPLTPRIAALRGAEMAMPGCDRLAISEEPEEDKSVADGSPRISDLPKSTRATRAEEGEGRDADGYKRPPEVDTTGYAWRTNLAKTQPFWNGWFDGLSEQLLTAPVQGKFLLLAGIDRLDKALTIGHMQGRFMMKVLPKCGHAVHEDVPEQVALAIADFLVRNKFAAPTSEHEAVDKTLPSC